MLAAPNFLKGHCNYILWQIYDSEVSTLSELLTSIAQAEVEHLG